MTHLWRAHGGFEARVEMLEAALAAEAAPLVGWLTAFHAATDGATQ